MYVGSWRRAVSRIWDKIFHSVSLLAILAVFRNEKAGKTVVFLGGGGLVFGVCGRSFRFFEIGKEEKREIHGDKSNNVEKREKLYHIASSFNIVFVQHRVFVEMERVHYGIGLFFPTLDSLLASSCHIFSVVVFSVQQLLVGFEVQ